MYEIQTVEVVKILEEHDGIQKLQTNGGAGRALLYLAACPRAEVGETIKVNVTAETLQLGTGGWDMVISTSQSDYKQRGKGHIMKARYTSCQHSVFAVDSPEHPDHSLFHSFFHLNDTPVLLAELHSMLPIILGALQMTSSSFKVGIVLTDDASLPAGLSDHMIKWKKDPDISVVTTGQAFGGNEEAVTIQNAIQWLSMKHHADFLIVSIGPGTVGTNTPYGFSGMAMAEWANIIGALEGTPVWIPRLSFHDKRERHQGLSHHTRTPLERFTYAPSILPLPETEEDKRKIFERQTATLKNKSHIKIVYENTEEWRRSWQSWYKNYSIPIKTMGREVSTKEIFIKGILAAVKHVHHMLH